MTNTQSSDTTERLANGLAWFSIGLGLTEVIAPGKLARWIGLPDTGRAESVTRFYGFREIAAGIGILAQPRAAAWVWARVAGDALDLASLTSALKSDDANRGRVSAASAAVLGVTALDVICATQLTKQNGSAVSANGSQGSTTVPTTRSVIIGRSPDEVYSFWRDFSHLSTFMSHLVSVTELDGGRSHWVATAPAGTTIEWDAELVEDQPGRKISWRSLPGAQVDNSGIVTFERAPGNRGTIVRVQLRYAPPAGVIGAAVAKLFGEEPGQQIEDDLRKLKQVLETGEVVHSDASIHDKMHAAQPPATVPQTAAATA